MDALLQTIGVQSFNFVVRSGIALTSRYAAQQCTRLLKSVNDRAVRAELKTLQRLLDNKIKIISPALDLIEFKSGRGNVFLESAVPLAKSLHRDIVRLGKRLDNAATTEEGADDAARRDRTSEAHHAELLLIIGDIKSLLERIDRDIPLLQLAITASGEKMSTRMTPGISPSRMMQASALLSFADAHFVMDPSQPMQVGPSFTLSLYMLFLGHSRVGPCSRGRASPLTPAGSEDETLSSGPYGLGDGERKPIWQEVMHKCRVRLCRTPVDWVFDPTHGYRPSNGYGPCPQATTSTTRKTTVALLGKSDGYSYHLEIIEDLLDGRLHDEDAGTAQPYDDMPSAGIRESIPIHQISKIFYTDTGRILNIGNNDERDNNPVLLLKRDASAKSPVKLRQEWFDEADAEDLDDADESHSDTADESSESDDQDDVDRQLWEETEHSPVGQDIPQTTRLPAHLDPEWLALEVYMDDEDDEDEDEDDNEGNDAGSEAGGSRQVLIHQSTTSEDRLSPNSKLADRLRHISLSAESPVQSAVGQPLADLQQNLQEQPAGSYVTRSPFGSINSSLSLLEMLIRLTSLQEFQQTSHLAIPDHILTFFLEETSTTGLQGEAHWKMKSEAKRRMGFDPYIDDSLPRQGGE